MDKLEYMEKLRELGMSMHPHASKWWVGCDTCGSMIYEAVRCEEGCTLYHHANEELATLDNDAHDCL